jgi:hypothetical protein
MGDGRTFDQAVRALDKLIAAHTQATPTQPDQSSPAGSGYEPTLVRSGTRAF